ncbi:isoamylase early set domain-containing protein [Hydrogenimonas sp.]
MVKISKRGKRAWVTFTLGGDGFESVRIKGSWNGWEPEAMKRKKNGDFYIVKVLPVGESFEFGYLVDEEGWLHDEALPSKRSPFGSDNSVLNV